MKGDKNMDYKAMRNQIEDMVNDNHKDFVKAIISMEKGINDESALDKLYDAYIDNDSLNLLHEEFDYMIEDLREQGQIKDLPYVQQEKDNLVNIVGNIVGKVELIERENKNGEAFKVANFSVVSKGDDGNKVYHNCSAYGERVIFQRTLSREILLSFLDKSELLLMTTVKNIPTSGYFLQNC